MTKDTQYPAACGGVVYSNFSMIHAGNHFNDPGIYFAALSLMLILYNLKKSVTYRFFRLLALSIISFLLFVPFLIPSTAWSATYYVDATNGNDSNPGLSGVTPWKTIAKVNASRFYPGDQILFKRGQVWREQLTIFSSGSAGNPIRFGAYSTGNTPEIKGSDTIGGWINDPARGVYYTVLDLKPTRVFQDGNDVPLKEASSPEEVMNSGGSWYYDGVTKRIFIQTTQKDKPISHLIEGVFRNYCISSYGGAEYIVIEELCMNQCSKAGIYSVLNNSWTIRRCKVFNSGENGIYACGKPTGNGEGSTTGWIIEGNTVGRVDCDTHLEYRAAIAVRGMYNPVIRNNVIKSVNAFGILLHRGGLGEGSTSSFAEIYGNEVTNCMSNIILFRSDNCKVYRNNIHDSRGGGIMVQYGSNNAQLFYNIIYNLSLPDYKDNYNGIDINTDSRNGRVYNNLVSKVAYACCTVEDTSPGPANGWEIRNNIFDARGNDPKDVPIMINPKISQVTLSNNNYINDPGFRAIGKWKGTNIASLDLWVSIVNADVGGDYSEANSISAPPLYRDISQRDFRLRQESPCIDGGFDVGLAEDFGGNAVPSGRRPEIGPFEYGSIAKPTNLKVKP